MKRLALIGSKDFAEQIQDFAEETGEYKVIGYFDDFEESGTFIRGLPILGPISNAISQYKKHTFDSVFFAAGYNNFEFREKVFSQLSNIIPFANIIMKSAEIHKHAKLGQGVFVGERSIIGKDAVIGDNVFIHGSSVIAHNSKVGDHTYFSGRDYVAGFTEIGKRVFIGLGVTVSDHIYIADDIWVGIGCIVAQDLKTVAKYISTSTRLIPAKK